MIKTHEVQKYDDILFDMASRFAYAFNIGSIRTLAPVLSEDICLIWNGLSLSGKDAVLTYLGELFTKEKLSESPSLTYVVTAKDLYGISLYSANRNKKLQVCQIDVNSSFVTKLNILEEKDLYVIEYHPYSHYNVMPTLGNYCTLAEMAIEDYQSLQQFRVRDSARYDCWRNAFIPLFNLLVSRNLYGNPVCCEFTSLYVEAAEYYK